MRKTLFEADSTTNIVKGLGVELTINLSNVKVLINGVDLTENIKINNLKVVAEE